ncbi:MAG: rod shape-determining protein RodA [Peptococcaceae bacterium]|nr:rod shape-determining protein RodA [Peptococcaceae bacterium]
MQARRILKNLDYSLILAVALILLLGLVAISSATHVTGNDAQDAYRYVKMQLLWVFLGTAAAVTLLFWRYEELVRYYKILYVVNLVLLAAVLITGREALGAQRWIQIGPFSFQPSEFAKIIIIVTLAAFLAEREEQLSRFRDLLPVFAFIGVPMVLIMLQPDLGTSLVFVGITIGMLFMAGAKPLLLGGLVAGGLFTAIGWIWAHLNYGVWLPLKEYQLQRLIIFLDPWSDWQGAGYNMIQSQIAIGSGGLWGRGIYNGTQNQLNFLPEQHTDFIFSVLAEEMGFVGVIILLTLYFMLLYRGVQIAAQARDTFGTLIAIGIVSMLIFHIFVNIGMNIGIMPVTGLPLPYFSYGGSAMLADLIALGLLLNIWVRRQKIVF